MNSCSVGGGEGACGEEEGEGGKLGGEGLNQLKMGKPSPPSNVSSNPNMVKHWIVRQNI
jgi:hypothetical protein